MGFGTSVTQAIFFIASAIIAVALVGVATIAITSVSNSFASKANQLSDQVKTGIVLTGDSCYFGDSTHIYIKNTGSSFLDANSTDIYLDGATRAFSSIHLFRNNEWIDYSTTNAWAPGELARFTLSASLPTGYHRVMAVSQHGVYDSIEYSDC